MKILHCNTNDIFGGAARAAYRIHKGLLGLGIKSQILVQNKQSNEPEIITPYKTKFGKLLTAFRPYINSSIQKLQTTTNPIHHSTNILPSGLHKYINESDTDIVHLHWINNEMISIKEISKIEKPIIWTLHDMWVFSGAEHYDIYNYERYQKGYLKDNRPDDYSGLDIDRWTWNRKMKHWQDVDFNFVTPSTWLASCLSNSLLFKSHQPKVIPNGLDTSIFKPTEKNIARRILNLPRNKKIVTYGAIGAEKNPIKGYSQLVKAKDILNSKCSITGLYFVVFGNDYVRTENKKGIKSKYFGTINDDITLSLIYSAADVMIVPSIMESFGQTAAESMACGTPVVAFNTSGLKDIIDHKQNGYLAEPYNPTGLADGINWILKNHNFSAKLGKKARKKVLNTFDSDKVASQYLHFYKEVLN